MIYSAQIHYDVSLALRAIGVELWVFSTDDIAQFEHTGRLSRRLSGAERFLLQGHYLELAEVRPLTVARFAAGNLWATPSVAAFCILMLKEMVFYM